MEGIFTSR